MSLKKSQKSNPGLVFVFVNDRVFNRTLQNKVSTVSRFYHFKKHTSCLNLLYFPDPSRMVGRIRILTTCDCGILGSTPGWYFGGGLVKKFQSRPEKFYVYIRTQSRFKYRISDCEINYKVNICIFIVVLYFSMVLVMIK